MSIARRLAEGQAAPRGLSALRYGIPLLALISAVAWGIWTYAEEIKAAEDQSLRNAELIGLFTERLVQTQTILQRSALARAGGEAPEFLQSEAFHRFLQEIEKSQPGTRGLAVVGRDGRMIASSRTFPVSFDMGPRDYLTAVAEGAPVFVDRILLEPSGQDAFVVVTPFAVGAFEGAIVSAVEIDLVRSFLSGIANDRGEAASLLRPDGKLLVRNVLSEPIQLPENATAYEAMRSSDAGTYKTVAVSDGIERYYGYTRISGLPLFANFGTPTTQAWMIWLGKGLPVWALLTAIGVFAFLLAGQIERSVNARLKAEANQRRLDEAERLAEQRRQLMNEMNHRVKNNLALVAALISLQMRNHGSVDGTELLARVMAVSEVHELLHTSEDGAQMDFGTILTRLCTSPAIVPAERPIRVDLDVAKGIVTDADHATALALSAAEILTNAVKHAFAGRACGTIRVRLQRSETGAVLDISDDGVGLPVTPGRSSGLRIVDGLVAQVGGTLERRSDNGTCVRIQFPLTGQVAGATPSVFVDPAEGARAAS
jgi:two-component sensor histidine kinase